MSKHLPIHRRDDAFDIRDGRAMVSLGPLSAKRFCTYACAFCYVHADFPKYASLPIPEIIDYLQGHAGEYDIVYVSGDTDSLAPPRTNKGLELLDALATLQTDVLFTTRAPLGSADLDRLAVLNERLSQQGNILFGCISISRLRSAPHLEPPPVPSPEQRLEVLGGLHARGIVSVLAMRPFLPVVPVEEYVEIARVAAPFADVILGEAWYADKGGVLVRQVLRADDPSELDFEEHRMDFDSNDAVWKVWGGKEVREKVGAFCSDAGIPFFMRSRPAILHVRELRKRKGGGGAVVGGACE